MSNKLIAVLGANGKSGQVFVDQALKDGYMVRAGVYSGDLPARDNLEVVKCNVMDSGDIQKIAEGADVIVSLIGHGKNSPAGLQQIAMKNIIEALSSSPNTRLISLTGTGVRVDGDKPNLVDKILNFGIKKVDPQRINDGIRHFEILRNSNIDWTVVRVLKLTNGQHEGEVSMNQTGPAELFTPRSRVAKAILQIIEEDQYHNQYPIIIGIKKEQD